MNPFSAQPAPTEDENPPVFRTWNQVYAFVLILHVVLIVLFYLFKITYA